MTVHNEQHAKGTTFDEYSSLGPYHTNLAISRGWLPCYFRRFHVVGQFLERYMPMDSPIVDIGGGEGIFVQQLRERGFKKVWGLDPYAPFVHQAMVKGSTFALPFATESIRATVSLDVMEHIPLNLQSAAANEMARVLDPEGLMLISVPNMAHLRSRIGFFFHGSPWRNKLQKHPGELTAQERSLVFQNAGLQLLDMVGFHLTLSYDPRPKGLIGKWMSHVMFSPRVPPSLCLSVVMLFGKIRPPWLHPGKHPLKEALRNYRPGEQDPTSA